MNKKEFNIPMETYGLQPKESVNPLIPIIEDMFSHELHESNWKNFTISSTIDLLKTKMLEKEIKITDRHFLLLNRKLKKCKNIKECLQILTDCMLGSSVDNI